MYELECIPISKPVRTAEPSFEQEPVTLAEAKHQCSVAQGVEFHNEFLTRLIVTAREQVENDTGIVCYTGTFTQKMTEWPYGELFPLDMVRPVTSITSITYVDGSGTTQTLSTDVYALETASVKQFVRLKYGQTWPATRGDINGITVTYVAGYATVLAVPQLIKQAVMLRVHCEWMNKNEMDSSSQEEAYQRIVDRLGRRTYP